MAAEIEKMDHLGFDQGSVRNKSSEMFLMQYYTVSSTGNCCQLSTSLASTQQTHLSCLFQSHVLYTGKQDYPCDWLHCS